MNLQPQSPRSELVVGAGVIGTPSSESSHSVAITYSPRHSPPSVSIQSETSYKSPIPHRAWLSLSVRVEVSALDEKALRLLFETEGTIVAEAPLKLVSLPPFDTVTLESSPLIMDDARLDPITIQKITDEIEIWCQSAADRDQVTVTLHQPSRPIRTFTPFCVEPPGSNRMDFALTEFLLKRLITESPFESLGESHRTHIEPLLEQLPGLSYPIAGAVFHTVSTFGADAIRKYSYFIVNHSADTLRILATTGLWSESDIQALYFTIDAKSYGVLRLDECRGLFLAPGLSPSKWAGCSAQNILNQYLNSALHALPKTDGVVHWDSPPHTLEFHKVIPLFIGGRKEISPTLETGDTKKFNVPQSLGSRLWKLIRNYF